MKRAVFLDRDGVISEEVGYLSDVSQLQLIPEAAQAVHLLNATGLKVFIITNQSGVARGYFSESTVKEVHREMEKCSQHKRLILMQSTIVPTTRRAQLNTIAENVIAGNPLPECSLRQQMNTVLI